MGFDELILNFKKSYLSIEEFHKFLLESANVESTYCRLLARLSSCLTHKFTASSCFYPIGDALRQFIEEIASVHDNVIGAYQTLIDQVSKYQLEQKQRQKQVKEEESRTAELITSLNTTYTSVNKARLNYHTWCAELKKVQSESTYLTNSNCRLMDKTERKVRIAGEEYRSLVKRYEQIREQFENKFTESCNKFQRIEEEHLNRMKNFCIAYTDAVLTCSENLRETRRKFILKCDQLSIDNILLAFVHARKTGSDHPPKLEFEEFCGRDADSGRKDVNGLASSNGKSAAAGSPTLADSSNNKGNVGNSTSGADPFFHAIFMGFWRSRDVQRSKRKRTKKQIASATDEALHSRVSSQPERPHTTDPSVLPSKAAENALPSPLHSKSSFISPCSERTSPVVRDLDFERDQSLHKWSSSSSLSASDDEARQKLSIEIKPVQNLDTEEWQKQNLDSIRQIFSQNMPRPPTRLSSARDGPDSGGKLRCSSAVPFVQRSESPTTSKTAPTTPVSQVAVRDPRLSWLAESQETLCPRLNDYAGDSVSTLVQCDGAREDFSIAAEDKNDDDPWAAFCFSRSMSLADSEREDFFTCSSVASSPVPCVKRLQRLPSERTPLGVALIEKTSEGSSITGALVFSFANSSISQLQPISFRLSGVDKVSKILINRNLLALRATEASERLYSVRIDKLQTTLQSKTSEGHPYVNIDLVRYQFHPVHFNQWMFIDFQSKSASAPALRKNQIQITPIERLRNFRLSMLLLHQDLRCAADEMASFSFVGSEDGGEQVEWCAPEKDLAPGDTRTISFDTKSPVSLKSMRTSFSVDRIASSKWEANQPFGSTVRFVLSASSDSFYAVSQLRYKARIENIQLG